MANIKENFQNKDTGVAQVSAVVDESRIWPSRVYAITFSAYISKGTTDYLRNQ